MQYFQPLLYAAYLSSNDQFSSRKQVFSSLFGNAVSFFISVFGAFRCFSVRVLLVFRQKEGCRGVATAL